MHDFGANFLGEGVPCAPVEVRLSLSVSQLVAALWLADLEWSDFANPREVEAAVAYAVVNFSLDELQYQAGALERREPADSVELRYLAACRGAAASVFGPFAPAAPQPVEAYDAVAC
jgi:hypothetical protein